MESLFKIAFVLIIIGLIIWFKSCDKSEGIKSGILQKVSHKTFPCDHYVAEFAFEGGKVKHSNESSAYENTQEVDLSQEAYDTLQNYVGYRVAFDYKDRGWVACRNSKLLTSLRVIKN